MTYTAPSVMLNNQFGWLKNVPFRSAFGAAELKHEEWRKLMGQIRDLEKVGTQLRDEHIRLGEQLRILNQTGQPDVIRGAAQQFVQQEEALTAKASVFPREIELKILVTRTRRADQEERRGAARVPRRHAICAGRIQVGRISEFPAESMQAAQAQPGALLLWRGSQMKR